MTRNWEARLDSSTPGESRLSKSAHPWEVETPRMREAVLGTMSNISANLRQNSFTGPSTRHQGGNGKLRMDVPTAFLLGR